jgi:uncharacterized membrane-anchored protein
MLAIDHDEKMGKVRGKEPTNAALRSFLDADCFKPGLKVPRITWAFWLIKILCTTVGETISDFFKSGLELGFSGASEIFFPILFIIVMVQFLTPSYTPLPYWLSVILMSICGTIATDSIHDTLGLELWKECVIFFWCLMMSFVSWLYIEKTVDIHSILSPRREFFYWVTVLLTFAMGTAVGDAISESAGIGYSRTFGLFIGLIGFFALLWTGKLWYTATFSAAHYDALDVALFWCLYILTRPLGASFGDLISAPVHDSAGPEIIVSGSTTKGPGLLVGGTKYPTASPTAQPTVTFVQGGGLGLGAGYTSLVFILVISACIAYISYTGYDRIDYLKVQVNAEAAAYPKEIAVMNAASEENFELKQNAKRPPK